MGVSKIHRYLPPAARGVTESSQLMGLLGIPDSWPLCVSLSLFRDFAARCEMSLRDGTTIGKSWRCLLLNMAKRSVGV